jgi:hypothetical protein
MRATTPRYPDDSSILAQAHQTITYTGDWGKGWVKTSGDWGKGWVKTGTMSWVRGQLEALTD